jgi:RNA polymerase sigma factor (sigma-70 family)
MIHLLNQELGWHLDAQEQERYEANLQRHLPQQYTQEQLRKIILNYHVDHALVEALQDNQHPQYEARWTAWFAQVQPILHKARLDWSSDLLFDEDDLAQLARAELVQAIGNFHFASRFSTWATKVIVQSVQRVIRDGYALKRAIRPDSLDQHRQVDVFIDDAEHPESAAGGHVLIKQVAVILEREADQRLAQIFRLWAVYDLRIEEIGKIMHLHPSRIRALLQQARQILREAPEIQSWNEDIKNINKSTSSS